MNNHQNFTLTELLKKKSHLCCNYADDNEKTYSPVCKRSYSCNCYINIRNKVNATTDKERSRNLGKLTEMTEPSISMIMLDDWRYSKFGSPSPASYRDCHAIKGITATIFPPFGNYGTHGRQANVLFGDGHAETTATFTVLTSDGDYANSFAIWYKAKERAVKSFD